ncbi:MAG: hypothetical protein KGM98_00720, partial [Bacteroidota bacterium]|nr:hypothetical protein [Bacteroidota bacterium]
MGQKWIWAFFSIATATGFGQSYPLTHYTPNDGLISSRVKRIWQDDVGRIYYLTYGGLSVYDGSTFNNFSTRDGLGNDQINDVAQGGADSVWVASNGHQLNILVNGRLRTFETADHFCPVINRFLKSEDHQWYVTSDEGLFRFDGRRFYRMPFGAAGRNEETDLDQIVEWGHFFLIVPWSASNRRSLILYDKALLGVCDGISDLGISEVTLGPGRQIWISTEKGIRLIDTAWLNKGKIALVLPGPKYRNISKLKNRSLAFDRAGNLWLYGSESIEKISASGVITRLISEKISQTDYITHLFEDREGVIWISTDGNGVWKCTTTSFQDFSYLGKDRLNATAITAAGDTTWIFNSQDNGVYRITWKHTRRFHLLPDMKGASVLAIHGTNLVLNSQKKMVWIRNK